MPAIGQTDLVQRVVVVGAGVIGLSVACRLLEAGYGVEVVARDLPGETTSDVAATLWYPYLALPQDLVTAWSAVSYDEFVRLAADERTGVRILGGTEVLDAVSPDPWWRDAVPALSRTTVAGYADAWSFDAPVIEMPVYLRWLADRVRSLGGSIVQQTLSVLPTDGLVVDCAGLGARELVGDDSMTPVRGQVVLVEQFGLDRWWLDETGPTYLVPRSRDVVVGGTDHVGEWDRTPSPQIAADILARAARLVPEVAAARVVAHKVGLRPARPEVRLERVGDVVHCYGHGGAGVTLSWGCADEVAALVAR